ncbi:MAG: hypothetical protein ACR5K5_00010 [Wolbachia sp.]
MLIYSLFIIHKERLINGTQRSFVEDWLSSTDFSSLGTAYSQCIQLQNNVNKDSKLKKKRFFNLLYFFYYIFIANIG